VAERAVPQVAWPDILTTAECAAYLRVHPKTLPRLIRRHALPCSLVGRRRRFRRSELDRWLEARKEV
jgi:excisionase family DNA binding protein